MLIDPAGSHVGHNKQRDYWAIHVVGVAPTMDNIGASDIYLLDTHIEQMNESEVVFVLNNMYWRNALIDKVAYERIGGVTPGWMVHFINSIHARGAILSEDTHNLIALTPRNQEKKQRITSALKLPLLNGKIHYLSTISSKYIDHLKKEMVLHPTWHDDGIDALSYIYQVLETHGFRWRIPLRKQTKATFIGLNAPTNIADGWLSV
jgi:hypothetical protein